MRRGMTLVELLIVIATLTVLLAVLFPVFGRSYAGCRLGPSCYGNLLQLGMGLAQYRADFDARLPPVTAMRRPAKGWVEAMLPYAKSLSLFQCPQEKTSRVASVDKAQNGYTDYWYNAHLSDLKFAAVRHPDKTFQLGDGNDGEDNSDGDYMRYGLPPHWYTDRGKPSFRHNEGANYCFADGHVKWLKPELVTTDLPATLHFTFVPK